MAVGDGRRLQYRWRRGDGTTEAAQCARTCRPTVRRARQCRRLACGRHVREFARVAPRCRVGHIQRTSAGMHIHINRAQVASAFVRPSLSFSRKRLLGGFGPAYLVEFFKVGQVTWFCTKVGQLTWICKILDQVTWPAQFAQVQITWFLEFEGQVTWFDKIVDQVTWETKCEDQITSTTTLQKWTRLPGRPDYLVAAKSGPDYLVAASWAVEGDGLL